MKRIHAYKTTSPIWSQRDRQQAHTVDIVTFFSPSAAKFWAEVVGTNFRVLSIGPTTRAAAERLNYREIRSCPTINLDSFIQSLECWISEEGVINS